MKDFNLGTLPVTLPFYGCAHYNIFHILNICTPDNTKYWVKQLGKFEKML